MNRDKKLLITGGVVAIGGMLGAASLLIGVGIARADSSDFLADVHDRGINNVYGDSALLQQGMTVCQNLDVGATPSYAAQNMYVHNPGLTAYESGAFVGIAVNDLCPWHQGQGFYVSRARMGWQV